jgi:hypothetical protein
MTDVDGSTSTIQGPDRLAVQFPMRLSEGMERPYFLGGSSRRPVYMWRWASTPDRADEGSATGLGTFAPFAAGSGLTHGARFERGAWEVQFTRVLAPPDSTRGAVSAWYQIYLDVPTPTTAYVAPIVAMLLTAGLGVVVVVRAQQRGQRAAKLS